MKDRFDLEQEIMKAWAICDDLGTLFEHVMERDLDKDTISNALLGLQTMYQMKFETLFDTFEQLIKEKKII